MKKHEIKKSSDTFPLNQGQLMPSFVQFSQRVIYADKKTLTLTLLAFGHPTQTQAWICGQ
jgi:hypothetical protein